MLRFVSMALLILLWGVATSPSRTPAVSIVALYRERMMLPPGATLHVQLKDANTGHVIASAMLENPHVPVHIDLAYEPSNVDPAHIYDVAARIFVNGEPFFATDMPANVVTQGNSSQVELVLQRVTSESAALLEDRRWTLAELNGHAISLEHSPYFELSDGRASGFGGCNRFTGGYKLHADEIEFTAAASTLMACPHPNVMGTESAFLNALSNVRYWKVTGSELQLFDSKRKALVRFEGSE